MKTAGYVARKYLYSPAPCVQVPTEPSRKSAIAMPVMFPLNVTVPPWRKKLRISARCRSMEKPNEKLCRPRIQLRRSDHSKPLRMKAPHRLSPELKNPDTLFCWIMEQVLAC